MMSTKVMVVVVNKDRDNRELLSQQLGREGYDTFTAASLEKLDQATQQKAKMALLIIDVAEFDQRLWKRCQALTKGGIPLILIAPRRNPAVQRQSMKFGVAGLLTRPLDFKDLMECVRMVLGE